MLELRYPDAESEMIGLSKQLVFIKEKGETWKSYFPLVGMEGMLSSMEEPIEAADHDSALAVLQERYGDRLISHEYLMAEKDGAEVPAIMVEIEQATVPVS